MGFGLRKEEPLVAASVGRTASRSVSADRSRPEGSLKRYPKGQPSEDLVVHDRYDSFSNAAMLMSQSRPTGKHGEAVTKQAEAQQAEADLPEQAMPRPGSFLDLFQDYAGAGYDIPEDILENAAYMEDFGKPHRAGNAADRSTEKEPPGAQSTGG